MSKSKKPRGYSSRHNQHRTQRNKGFKLDYQLLETRNLLAADLINWDMSVALSEIAGKESATTKIAATHSYLAEGSPQDMVILSDRVAVRRNFSVLNQQDAEVLASLRMEFSRPLDSEFDVYTTSTRLNQQAVARLIDSNWAASWVPVFGILSSQSEAVLLNEVIVALPPEISPESYFADGRFNSFRRLDGTPDQFVATLSAGYGEVALSEINQLQTDDNIVWAAPNFYQNWQKMYIPNDPRFENLWHLHNVGQGGGLVDADSNLPEAWDILPGGSESIVIGIVDDGVANNHPDLFNWVNPGEVVGNGVDDDGNGWIDDIHGWNFVTNTNVSTPEFSQDNHGTAVAGVAAARGDNGIGVTGAAYRSPVISARIFRGNSVASDAGIASAIYYVSGRTQNGLGTWDAADIANHSWGGGGVSTAINAAITWATTEGRGGLGVPQFFASGNGNGNVIYPASQALVNPGVVAVGAMNNFGEKSNYSSFGAAQVIVAGSSDTRTGFLRIDTTDRVGSAGYAPGDYTGTGSTGFGGTSSAAPLATGIGALALARAAELNLDLSAIDLRKLVQANTKLAGSTPYDLETGRNNLMGHGLIDAETLIRGIGRAQISITSETGVIQSGDSMAVEDTFVEGFSDFRLRIRNQGTEPLSLSNLAISGSDFQIAEAPATNSLEIGEATTFVVRFAPSQGGNRTGVLTIQSSDDLSPLFQINLNGFGRVANVSGFVFEDRSGDGLRQVGEAGVAEISVFVDQNGNGIFDEALATDSFTNNTSAPITDFNTTLSSLNVSGIENSITQLRVFANITHTYMGDLRISLIAPNGDRVLLFNRRGGGGNNLNGTIFDDDAALPIASGSAPFTGSFRPEESLASLRGLNPNGQWTLEVSDLAAGDTGTLNNWTLEVTSGERLTTTDQNGFYRFADLPTGNFSVVVMPETGWSTSGVTSHPIEISSPNDSFNGRHFGMGGNNRFYAHVFHDQNGNGNVDPGESGRSDRILFLDGNGNGIFDPAQDFFFGVTPNLPINDLTTIESELVVSGLSGAILDVDVTVNITHTWTGDLRIWLIHPNGQQVELFNRRGGSGDNLTDTIFDDEAASPISDGSAPFNGTFRPEQPLAALNGLDANGTWKLRVSDLANGDTGTLNQWEIKINASPDTGLVTGADGWAYLDLPDGNHEIILTDGGWNFTAPADGVRNVIANGAPIYNQTYGERDAVAIVSGGLVYYGGSFFADGGVSSAIDSQKSLAQEGPAPQTLSFDNLINTTRGINGVVFEIQNLPGQSLSSQDFLFQMSPQGNFNEAANPPIDWTAAPQPSSITFLPDSSDRVLIEWPDNVIENRWLRITILANATTGLPDPEVFYLGHLLGEVTGLSGNTYSVTVADANGISTAVSPGSVGVGNIFDINKSGNVSNADIIMMTSGIGNLQLRNITIPASDNGSTQGLFSGFESGNSKDSGGQEFWIPAFVSDDFSLNLGRVAAFGASSNVEKSSDIPIEGIQRKRITQSTTPLEVFAHEGWSEPSNLKTTIERSKLAAYRHSQNLNSLLENLDRTFSGFSFDDLEIDG